MSVAMAFCITEAAATTTASASSERPQDVIEICPSSVSPAGVDRVDSEVDVDGICDLALSRPDFKLVLLGSRSSPRRNALAASS